MMFNKAILSVCLIFQLSNFSNVAQAQTRAVDASYPIASKSYNSITLSGSVEAKNDASLAPLEEGLVVQINVEVGDKVSKGQVLLELDDSIAKLMLEQTRASLAAATIAFDEAQRQYKEVEALSEQQLAALSLKQERLAALNTAKAAVTLAQADLNLQQEILNRHRLTAPFDGVVYDRQVDVGEWVDRSSQILSLVSSDDLRLRLAVPQQYFSSLSQLTGKAVSVTPDTKNGRSYNGNLTRVVAATDTQSRTFIAHVSLPNETDMISGMSAQATISLVDNAFGDEAQGPMWLPATAIKQHPDGGASVFKVENGRAKRQVVEVVEYRGSQVLLSNLQAGSAYIVSSVSLLGDNDEVLATINGEAL